MDLLVIGAGPAGLAVAGAALDQGLEVEVVEATNQVGSSWRGHYDRLHLHTTRRLSALPGEPIPASAGTWVARDDFVGYLEDYARRRRIPIRFETPVERVERAPEPGAGWVARTPGGARQAANVAVATGYNHTPHIPDWPGRETYPGTLVHSSEYRNPAPYRGLDVLVVGSGNSGAEIAADLAAGGAREVWCSIRTPPNIVRRNVGPLANQHLGILASALPPGFVDWLSLTIQRATIGDLSPYGLAAPAVGAFTRHARDEQIPLIDVGFLDALRRGRIGVVPGVDALDGEWVICGRHRVRAQALIAATGYERGLGALAAHLGVLDARGRPLVHAPDAPPGAPGLYFVGYRNPLIGNLLDVSRVARRLADRLAAAAP